MFMYFMRAITYSMFDKSEHPIMIETPKKFFKVRLQHPADHAAGDGLIEGRQGVMGAELWSARRGQPRRWATANSVAVSSGFDPNSGDQGVSRRRLDFSGDRFNAKGAMLIEEGLDPVVMVTK